MSNSDLIRDEIMETIEKIWGIKSYSYEQNQRGYLNLKWKINTDSGPLFVKQYNWDRYSSLENVKRALEFQCLLKQQNIKCPHIFEANGHLIQETRTGERFTVSEFCEGNVLVPGSVNSDQMYSLGQATGKMHLILNSKRTRHALHWNVPSKEEMMVDWNRRWKEAIKKDSSYYIGALEKQRRIIDNIDLSLFSGCDEGWVHWDLWVDNLLFSKHELSAILDFDRLHYIYPEFDISRAILSCTLRFEELNNNVAYAFLKGYKEYIPLTREKVIRSIKLTYWKEAEWVGVQAEQSGDAIQRFVEESIWISDNWSYLNEIF